LHIALCKVAGRVNTPIATRSDSRSLDDVNCPRAPLSVTTPGRFTAGAREYAKNVAAQLRLIDGGELTLNVPSPD
jgi:restriction endonuclease Mrr